MTMQQPEALRLADKYEAEGFLGDQRFAQDQWCGQAAAELRRQHARIAEMEEQMAAIGAGGVEPLRKRAEAHDLAARQRELQLLGEIEALERLALNVLKQLGVEATPIAWYVTGCSTMLSEHDAKAEAKRCGGSAKAVPLYTAPPAKHGLYALASGVQEGWKLVPVEPTMAMLCAGEAADGPRSAWPRMLAAAPQPPAVKESLTPASTVNQQLTVPTAQGLDMMLDCKSGKWLTVVYRDILSGDEARAIAEHPKVSALSWSHALRDRDAAIAAQAKQGG